MQKYIQGFEGRYFITDTGEVINAQTGTVRKFKKNKGYNFVSFRVNGKNKDFPVHRLVGFAFIENNNPEANQINHKNGIRDDNRVENLEWVTRSQNVKHSYDVLNRKRSQSLLGKFGDKHHTSKPIYAFIPPAILYFGSANEASRELGISLTGICNAAKGVKKHIYGISFEYAK